MDGKGGIGLLETSENSHEGGPCIKKRRVSFELEADFLEIRRGGSRGGGEGRWGRAGSGITCGGS